MFEHLLVPLDGSALAEAALPAAAYLAPRLNAWVILIHVIERDAPQEIHGQRHLAEADEACTYLDEVAVRAFPAGVRVETHVHTAAASDIAQSIVAHEDELAPGLIVMCTHGQSGLRTRLFGSVAQKIIGLGTTPVLLVQPKRAGNAEYACRRVLVPLDGNPDHEQGLGAAAELAEACAASLDLVRVVHTLSTLPEKHGASARLLPGATSALLDMAEDEAAARLCQQMAELRDKGLAVTATVQRGDPAKAILRTARRTGADLIVLGTHGRSGLDGLWSESVAPQIISRSQVPLLLVPVHRSGE